MPPSMPILRPGRKRRPTILRTLSTSDRQADENPYALDITYEVPRNDGEWFAVVFTIYTDTGGAHPNTDFAAMNYVMPDGWRIYLPGNFCRPEGARQDQRARHRRPDQTPRPAPTG